MSDPIAETIIARVVTVLRAIDGGAYSATVRTVPVVGTYNYDMTDAPTDRIVRGGMGEHTVDGAQVYVWVDFSQPPLPRTTCDDTATLTLSMLGYGVSEADEGDARQQAGLRLAQDLKVALAIDAAAGGPPDSLGALAIYSTTITLQEVQGQADSVGYADPGISMQVVFTYNLPGGVGL